MFWLMGLMIGPIFNLSLHWSLTLSWLPVPGLLLFPFATAWTASVLRRNAAVFSRRALRILPSLFIWGALGAASFPAADWDWKGILFSYILLGIALYELHLLENDSPQRQSPALREVSVLGWPVLYALIAAYSIGHSFAAQHADHAGTAYLACASIALAPSLALGFAYASAVKKLGPWRTRIGVVLSLICPLAIAGIWDDWFWIAAPVAALLALLGAVVGERFGPAAKPGASVDAAPNIKGAAASSGGPPAAARPNPSPAPPDPRETLLGGSASTLIDGKYELLRQIGSGGMGLVYEGLDRRLDRRVAVKKMRGDIGLNLRDRKRFLEEARTSAKLRHPGIVAVYDVVDDARSGEVHLIFEYVEGLTLERWLDELRPSALAAARARPILRATAEALAYAHANGVIHRDVKPSNIMAAAEGGVKVMDFGIARVMKDTVTRMTGLRDSSGSPAYMAPEQELGRWDARSDVFALGATGYELLSGEPPFTASNPLAQKERGMFRPLLESAPGTPKELAEAVEKCLRPDPKDRFQTAEEFARAIG